MGRLIVLQFENKADLEDPEWPPGAEMIAEYYMPPANLYCECDPKKRLHVNNWKRHWRFGLFVCRGCGKPSKHWRTGVMSRLQEALGTNLLDARRPKVAE